MVEKNSSCRKKKGSDDLVVAETVKMATLASTKSFDITEEEIRSKKIRMGNKCIYIFFLIWKIIIWYCFYLYTVDAQSKSAKNTRQHLEKFALDPKDGKLVIIEKSLISGYYQYKFESIFYKSTFTCHKNQPQILMIIYY